MGRGATAYLGSEGCGLPLPPPAHCWDCVCVQSNSIQFNRYPKDLDPIPTFFFPVETSEIEDERTMLRTHVSFLSLFFLFLPYLLGSKARAKPREEKKKKKRVFGRQGGGGAGAGAGAGFVRSCVPGLRVVPWFAPDRGILDESFWLLGLLGLGCGGWCVVCGWLAG